MEKTPSRSRAGSLTTLEAVWNKKRQRENSERQNYEDIFKRSKLIQRSPLKLGNTDNPNQDTQLSEQEMDLIIKKLDEMTAEMKGVKEEVKKNSEAIGKSGAELKAELRVLGSKTDELRKDLEIEKANWQAERTAIYAELSEVRKEIGVLKDKDERRQRDERSKNIIIAGASFTGTNQQIKEKVEDFCRSTLQTRITVEEAYNLPNKDGAMSRTLAKLSTRDEKNTLMKKKWELKHLPEKIFINDDLSKEERKEQQLLRKGAKNLRDQGLEVKVTRRKLMIKENGQWSELKPDDKRDQSSHEKGQLKKLANVPGSSSAGTAPYQPIL